jgi:uncharacterized membrane protein YfcA
MQTPVPPGSTTARDGLLIALAVVTLVYLVVFARALWLRAKAGEKISTPFPIWVVSFVANFFDTLGIGSYATTTTMFRPWKMVPDETLPGTLNVGYVIPTVVETFIFMTIVHVDATTLISMIAAAMAGAWFGAGVVSSFSRRKVQIGMGACLIGLALVMAGKSLGVLPPGGTLIGLSGASLVIGVVGNFLLGSLMTLGIGMYAPCMILVSLLGMNPITAFPIMTGSCAFLMPIASIKFVRTGRFDVKAMIGMTLAGIPAVLIAAFIVKTLPLNVLQWVVVVVVIYTATNMLLAARRERALAMAATMAGATPAL